MATTTNWEGYTQEVADDPRAGLTREQLNEIGKANPLSRKEYTADDIKQQILFKIDSNGFADGLERYNPNMSATNTLAEQLKGQAKAYGIKYDNKMGNADTHAMRLAGRLAVHGIDNIKTLRKKDDKTLVDTATGKTFDLATINKDMEVAMGEGYTRYQVNFDSKGRPVFTNTWEDSSDKKKIAAVAGLALNILAPGAGGALGQAMGLSGNVASMVGNGLVQGGLAAAGGATGKNLLLATLAPAAGQATSLIPGVSGLSPVLQKAISGGASGLVRSGGDVNGALVGALTGAVPGNLVAGNPQLSALLKAIIGHRIGKVIPRKP